MRIFLFLAGFCLFTMASPRCGDFNHPVEYPHAFDHRQWVVCAFNSNDQEFLRAVTYYYNQEMILYKCSLIMGVRNALVSEAFAPRHPFRPDTLDPVFKRYWVFLTSSFNRLELYCRINYMLRNEGFTHSHLGVGEKESKDVSKALKAEDAKCDVGVKLLPTSQQIPSNRDHAIVMIRFDDFSLETHQKLSAQLFEAMNKDVDIILDLRENTGGMLWYMQSLCGFFFTSATELGVIASRDLIKELYGDPQATYDRKAVFNFSFVAKDFKGSLYSETHPSDIARRYCGHIAIIIGPNSKSAAETFAYVMQLHKKATIIGHRTSGYALASQVFPLAPTMEVQLPIGEIIFSDGACLEGTGVIPELDLATMSLEQAIEQWIARAHAKDLGR